MKEKNGSLTGRLFKNLPVSTKKISKLQLVGLLIISAFVLLSPLFLSNYRLNLIIGILSAAYLAQCWNLMSGFTGQFSFGHAAFYGLGAYTSSILYTDFGVTPWFGMLVGMVVAGAVAAVIGYLSFHYNLRGDYFALATLAFAEILRVIFKNTPALHAASGVSIIFKRDWTSMMFGGKEGYLYMAFLMLAALTFLLYKLRKTKSGLYFVAIRENEDAAKALGINAFKYKMIALIASAMLTALGGTFYAQYYLYIDPTIAFGSTISVNAIAPCIIGGVGTIFGPILGACILEPISELTNAYLSKFVGMNMVIYGSILVAAIILMPHGVLGLWDKLKNRRKPEKKQAAEVSEPT